MPRRPAAAATASSSVPSISRSPANDASWPRMLFSLVLDRRALRIGFEQLRPHDPICGNEALDDGSGVAERQALELESRDDAAVSDARLGKHAATAPAKVPHHPHDPLRPGRRRVEPRQIGVACKHCRRAQLIVDEIPADVAPQRAVDADAGKAVDAQSLGGVLAGEPVQVVRLLLGRDVAPDRQEPGVLSAVMARPLPGKLTLPGRRRHLGHSCRRAST